MQQTHEYLQCLICLEFAKEAVECEQCNNLMCEECIKGLKKRECPSCRKINFAVKPNVLARRMIGAMPCDCPNKCGEKTTIGNLPTHLKKCSNRVFVCNKEECKFEGKRKEFIEHILQTHEERVLAMFDSEMSKQLEEDKTDGVEQSQIIGGIDRIGTMKNAKGRTARLGETGKYYCGGALETNCMCCNGYCGPDNGCNCFSCMKLDLTVRALPKGYLVNREGFAAKKGTTGSFYCGRKCLVGVAFCDGHCGPTNGPACVSCKVLNEQVNNRYKNLL